MSKKKKITPKSQPAATPKRAFSSSAPAAIVPESISAISADQSETEGDPEPVEPTAGIIPTFKPAPPKEDQPVSESKRKGVYKAISPSNLVPPFAVNRKS